MRVFAAWLATALGQNCSADSVAERDGCSGFTVKDDGTVSGHDSIEEVLKQYVPKEKIDEVLRILYGWNAGSGVRPLDIPADLAKSAAGANVDLQAYKVLAGQEQLRDPNLVRIGIIQNSIVLPTSAPIKDQKQALGERVSQIIDMAGAMGVNVLGLQETWMMPFAFATREKSFTEFAESAEDGWSFKLLAPLAKKYNMVIINPILERDAVHGDTLWNTAVVIGNNGNFIGKHRKNHIPRVGDFNEATYYTEGNTGHPVFETKFGKIGINICYGRHHPLNWQAFGLNGAEIVFNPSATVGALSEPMWPIEARNAAIASTYYVAAINRVGTEVFENAFTSGDGKAPHKDFGHFYGSSYIANPDGSRTPGLSRHRDGLMVTEVDLNLVQQVKDRWMFRITARYELYAKLFNDYIQHDFKPQIIRDPSLDG